MSTAKQQIFDTVLSINPYNDSYYIGAGNQLTFAKTPQFGKKQFAVSYLNTNDFITAQISISKNIPDDDLAFVIETKAYEELALDMAIEYTIDYVELPGEGAKERTFHVFIVDPLIIDEVYSDVIGSIQYVDQIVPAPLLLKSLYTYEILNNYGAHCFIYFQEHDAFFTLYENQQFLYTKSLKYAFSEMHDRFCELLGEQIEYSAFISLLSNEGLSTKNPEHQKYLIKLFGELFLHINDVLTYAKRAYEIESIEAVYIGSQIGAIIGLDEYCQTYLGFEAEPFDFSYGFALEDYVDQMHQLLQLYANTDTEGRYEANFSTFHRPPPFFQRHSGKLIGVAAASLIFAFAYPVVYWTMAYAESVHKSLLDKQYQETHAIKLTREQTINLKLAQKADAQKLLNQEIALFEERKGTLTKIHEVKVRYPMKGEIMAEMTRYMNRFNVGVSDVMYAQDETIKAFTMRLMAKKDKQITNLLEYLTKHKAKHYSYNIELIEFDDKNEFYRSDMKVVIK